MKLTAFDKGERSTADFFPPETRVNYLDPYGTRRGKVDKNAEKPKDRRFNNKPKLYLLECAAELVK